MIKKRPTQAQKKLMEAEREICRYKAEIDRLSVEIKRLNKEVGTAIYAQMYETVFERISKREFIVSVYGQKYHVVSKKRIRIGKFE